jgi:uncharacterized protein
MGKKKIFNDPLYGLIQFKHDIIYDLIEEPCFQRLRRIHQMGMSHYVYSGATHPRLQHVMGATYLLSRALNSLTLKGVEITDKEYEAASIAILCHDLGHGPFSHALERKIVPMHHEELTLLYMRELEEKYGSPLTLAIQIFENQYPKRFLHQLISSQLDMDRLDYLSRDSYFTGVVEGIVGYDRILNMINVADSQIVVEEKGIHSVEKFLIARYMMYLQVYLHKTSIIAEQMLKSILERIEILVLSGQSVEMSQNLLYFFNNKSLKIDSKELIYYFSLLDDYDVWDVIKRNSQHSDKMLNFLCKSLLNRELFKLSLRVIDSDFIEPADKTNFYFTGEESINCYDLRSHEIMIITKENEVKPLSSFAGLASILSRNEKITYEITGKNNS